MEQFNNKNIENKIPTISTTTKFKTIDSNDFLWGESGIKDYDSKDNEFYASNEENETNTSVNFSTTTNINYIHLNETSTSSNILLNNKQNKFDNFLINKKENLKKNKNNQKNTLTANLIINVLNDANLIDNIFTTKQTISKKDLSNNITNNFLLNNNTNQTNLNNFALTYITTDELEMFYKALSILIIFFFFTCICNALICCCFCRQIKTTPKNIHKQKKLVSLTSNNNNISNNCGTLTKKNKEKENNINNCYDSYWIPNAGFISYNEQNSFFLN